SCTAARNCSGEKSRNPKNHRRVIAGGVSGRGWRMPPTWPGLSWVETGRAATARRLFGPLPGVSESDKIGANTGVCTARRRNGLRNHKGGSGKTRAHVGWAGWHSDGGIPFLLHVRSPAIDI